MPCRGRAAHSRLAMGMPQQAFGQQPGGPNNSEPAAGACAM